MLSSLSGGVLAHAVQESSVVYWSDEVGFNSVYGKITVTLKSSSEAGGFVTRKFEVLEEGKVCTMRSSGVVSYNVIVYAMSICI